MTDDGASIKLSSYESIEVECGSYLFDLEAAFAHLRDSGVPTHAQLTFSHPPGSRALNISARWGKGTQRFQMPLPFAAAS